MSKRCRSEIKEIVKLNGEWRKRILKQVYFLGPDSDKFYRGENHTLWYTVFAKTLLHVYYYIRTVAAIYKIDLNY